MLAYLRRHHIGLLALFIALGGTSYAAAKLPRNSVGTPQIKSAAVTKAKLAPAVRKRLGKPGRRVRAGPQGSPGLTGLQGPKGDTGATGAQGETGPSGRRRRPRACRASPGRRRPASDGVNTNIVIGGALEHVRSGRERDARQPGKVMVLVTGTFSVRCTAADTCAP